MRWRDRCRDGHVRQRPGGAGRSGPRAASPGGRGPRSEKRDRRRRHEGRHGGRPHAAAAESGRQRAASGWCDRAALGHLSRRRTARRSPDSKRSQRQGGQSRRRHAARDGVAVRQAGDRPEAAEGRSRREGSGSQRADAVDACRAQRQPRGDQGAHRRRRERQRPRKHPWHDGADVGGRAETS